MPEGMRRRHVPQADATGAGARPKIVNLQRFDTFAKVHDDYLQKSGTGGAVTLGTVCILAVLFWLEVDEFMTAEVEHSFSVDASFRQRMPVTAEITFPGVRCDLVTVETVDHKGAPMSDVVGKFHSAELDTAGRVVHPTPSEAGECLPCLAGASEQRKCCNSCADLLMAYVEAGRPADALLGASAQCASVGCRLGGTIEVPKGSGGVRFALGRSLLASAASNVGMIAKLLNVSHTVHQVAFGENLPGIEWTKVEGVTRTAEQFTTFQYFLKLVPTKYTDRKGNVVASNQYSWKDTRRAIKLKRKPDGGAMLNEVPAVTVSYDVSPFVMEMTAKVKPWSYIFTSTCALIGGIYSIAQLVELLVSSVLGRVWC